MLICDHFLDCEMVHGFRGSRRHEQGMVHKVAAEEPKVLSTGIPVWPHVHVRYMVPEGSIYGSGGFGKTK